MTSAPAGSSLVPFVVENRAYSGIAANDPVWSEPLTPNERAIIDEALVSGSGNDARRWLRHVLKVYDAREASRG